MNPSKITLLLIALPLIPLRAAFASPPVTWEELRHLPQDCPVLYDNDWLTDTNDDEYLLARAQLGQANLNGFILSKDQWDHGRQYELEDGQKDFERGLGIARRAGFRNVPELTIGADRLLERPASGKIEETKVVPSAGTDLIVREARKASTEKPLVVIVGGPLCTVASAYLSDLSISDRMVVMMTDIDGYNGSDQWANYVVATRCKLVNFGASPLWWPQRPDPPIMPPGRFDSLPDSEITRSMKEVAQRFWDRSTRKEKPDRDDGFADGAGTFLLYRPETWKGVKNVRVTRAWSHEDAPEGTYHYLDATGIAPGLMTEEFFGTLSKALGGPSDRTEVAEKPDPLTSSRPAGDHLVVCSFRTGDLELFAVDLATGDAWNLTRSPKSVEKYPACSFAGDRVAFISNRDGTDNLYVMNADGSEVRQLTDEKPGIDAGMASWTADDRWLYFGLYGGGPPRMCRILPDGSGLEVIGNGIDPAVSPDGERIAFARSLDDGQHLFVAKSNGSDARQLTAKGNGWGGIHPTWTPDGKRIIYGDKVGETIELFACEPDTGTITQLTRLEGAATSPSVSPDGKWITFRFCDEVYWRSGESSKRAYDERRADKRPVWIMGVDGSDPHVIELLHYHTTIDGSRAPFLKKR